MEKVILEMWDEYSKCPLYLQSAVNIPASYKQDANSLIESQKLAIEIVSATRCSEADFWTKSALGLSLKRHLKQDARLSAKISFENTRGLSEIYNESIDQAAKETTLVFIHDDVWIDEANFADVVAQGLDHFDIIGVLGNKRRLPNQLGREMVDLNFNCDAQENLSGQLAHSKSAFGAAKVFGDAPASCELLDGIFLAAKKESLDNHGVRFDRQFDFHFYDLDFCNTAKQAGLTLGTWLVHLTHQSIGKYGTKEWHEKYQRYLNKWEESEIQKVAIPNNVVVNQNHHALQQAVEDVFEIALAHQNAGRLVQAEQLYQEILRISANHSAANHNLGVIEAGLKGVQVALPYLEIAVQKKPDNEQYWVTYIDALMQSGAIEKAMEALTLGQKFGLRPEMAQMMAAEYVKEFDR
jgi:tetratricopeptide (TPR) repeat protein